MDNNVPINRHVMKNKGVSNNSDSNGNEKTVDEFASAFPDWNLVPPAVVIKRVRRGK